MIMPSFQFDDGFAEPNPIGQDGSQSVISFPQVKPLLTLPVDLTILPGQQDWIGQGFQPIPAQFLHLGPKDRVAKGEILHPVIHHVFPEFARGTSPPEAAGFLPNRHLVTSLGQRPRTDQTTDSRADHRNTHLTFLPTNQPTNQQSTKHTNQQT